ncbi:HalOD1 output domain-containing protein [Haladaptatus sp. CMAA 1911]|uniref:HalOD1 output domain-containing protein n=1 Tax=unclassified Haladaptatus TaxID=2622732 RepID=UPI00375535D9
MTLETTTWFGSGVDASDPSRSSQYALVASETIDPEVSRPEIVIGVVDVIMDVIEPTVGQTTLSLYEYVNPDALEDIIEVSASKKSDNEVRSTTEDYLVTVWSDYTILIYKPIGTQLDTGENPCPTS